MRLKDADELLYQIQTTYCKDCKDCKDCDKDKEFFHCCIEQIIGIIKLAPIVDPWHYPSKGDYPEKGVEVWDGYEIVYYLPDLKRWCRYYTDYQIETPLVWMPLPEPPKEEV